MAGLPTSPLQGISLLFLKSDDIVNQTNDNTRFINDLDIIYAIEEICGRGTIEGAQKIGKLYRIYIKTEQARDKLSTEGFTFGGQHVSFFTKNPFTVKDQPETVKIIIGGVPLSVANSEFEKALLDLNVKLVSDIKFENYRDRDGKWTSYKTGRRFVYCVKPALNLKPSIKIGLWYGSLYYKEQVRPKRGEQRQNMSSHTDSEVIPTNTDNVGISSGSASEHTDSGKLSSVNTSSIDTNHESGKIFTAPTPNVSIDTPDRVIDTSEEASSGKSSQPKSDSDGSSAALSTERKGRKDTSFQVNQNKITNFVSRTRSRSHSLGSKRKEMVSFKMSPRPLKSVKNSPCQQNGNDTKYKQPMDWFNNCFTENLDSS